MMHGTTNIKLLKAVISLTISLFIFLIVPVFLYGCETWSLIWREEYGLRMLENRVLRRIFGHKREKV